MPLSSETTYEFDYLKVQERDTNPFIDGRIVLFTGVYSQKNVSQLRALMLLSQTGIWNVDVREDKSYSNSPALRVTVSARVVVNTDGAISAMNVFLDEAEKTIKRFNADYEEAEKRVSLFTEMAIADERIEKSFQLAQKEIGK